MQKSVVARTAVFVLFWSIAAYGIVALLGSVVLSLYGKPPAETSSASTFERRQRAWCLAQLSGLRDDLVTEVRYELALTEASNKASRWPTFRDSWRGDLMAATTRCSEMNDPLLARGYDQLTELGALYENMVDEALRGQRDIEPSLRDTVRALKDELNLDRR